MPKDSVDKIVQTYLAGICTKSFSYKNKIYNPPKKVRVSPGIFRSFTCPSSCGACCKSWSVDWLPGEEKAKSSLLRRIYINRKVKEVYSNVEYDNNKFCHFLNLEDGRCNIHKCNPFTCDFELIRFSFFEKENKVNITTRLYGRGWCMLRIDGERRAKCVIGEITKSSIKDTIRKLCRLKDWCNYFEIETYIDDIISWAKDPNRRIQPLILEKGGRG